MLGVSTEALKWFTSYLRNRSQRVCINSTLSDALDICTEGPQGSILGPVLFSIYMNDLPSVPLECAAECYVDDTKMFKCFSVRDYDLAMSFVNEDLIRICNWCFQNLLLLNPGKTHLMVYGSRQFVSKLPENFHISLLGKEVFPSETVKDLGVIFDPYLDFNEHTIKVTCSCMSILGQINRVKHVFDKELLISIIYTLAFTKLYYCSSVWSTTSERNLKKLQSVQNFASHIIGGLQKYDHVTPILKELNWIPVKKQLFYRDAVFVFKCMKGMAPSYLSSQFTTRGTISGRITRQSDHLNILLFTSATSQKSFQYRIVKLWNDLP